MYCDSKLGNSAAERVISTIETLADLAGHIVNCKLNEEPGSSFIVPREKWDESKTKTGSVERRGEERGGEIKTFPYLHFLPASLLFFICSFVKVGWDQRKAAFAKR